MKEVYTHIPPHTHANVLKVSRNIFLSTVVFRSLFSWFLALTQNSVILIMQPHSLYLLRLLLSSLCFTLFLHLRVVATYSNWVS